MTRAMGLVMGNLHPMLEKARDQALPLPDFASVLIVDDHRFDRQRLSRLCDQLDFETHVAEVADLESMGTALDQDVFDLVILDYNLPDGTGLDAIKAIKSHSKHRRAAIIMVTGENQSEVAIEAMKRGCSDYIDKNVISLESLRRATVNALQKSALSAGIETQEMIRKRVEKVLRHFTRECVLEIKPMLSRMMRQLRNLGDRSGEMNPQTQADLDRSCMRLWEFLTDLEGLDGQDFVEREFPATNPLAPQVPTGASEDHENSANVESSETGPTRPRRPTTKSGRLFSRYT